MSLAGSENLAGGGQLIGGGGGIGGGGFPPGDGLGTETDETPQYPLVLRSNPEVNSMLTHGLSRLLLSLLLRILPPQDTRSEIADHGYQAEAQTPDPILESPEMLRLAVRPSQVPFAVPGVDPRNQGPRSTLRVSR